MKKLFRSFWVKYYLKELRLYRKWYGGVWEYHYIDICHSYIWLAMPIGKCWPEYRQPCSIGCYSIEVYPYKA